MMTWQGDKTKEKADGKQGQGKDDMAKSQDMAPRTRLMASKTSQAQVGQGFGKVTRWTK